MRRILAIVLGLLAILFGTATITSTDDHRNRIRNQRLELQKHDAEVVAKYAQKYGHPPESAQHYFDAIESLEAAVPFYHYGVGSLSILMGMVLCFLQLRMARGRMRPAASSDAVHPRAKLP